MAARSRASSPGMRPRTVWGVVEPLSASSDSKDSGSRSSHMSLEHGKDHSRLKRVPATLQSYFNLDNSQNTSSSKSKESESDDSSCLRPKVDSFECVAANPDIAMFIEARMQALGTSESRQMARASASVDEDYGDGADVSVQDRAMFERVVATVGLWSKGCVQHVARACKPCHYVHCKEGCASGSDCRFCHFPHTDNYRQGLSVGKRRYCKHFADLLMNACCGDDEKFEQVHRASAYYSSYLQAILLARCRDRGGAGGFEPSSRSGRALGMQTNIVSL